MILLAVGIVTTQLGEIGQSVGRFYNFSGLPLILAVVFLVITGHEFAHGPTCKYFGGEVREMGFMMIYFQPALYCNVSDAWLFPEKSKRLWVTFAGPYFELFLWALATLTWRVTESGTGVRWGAVVGMVTSGLKLFLKLHPLVQPGGY